MKFNEFLASAIPVFLIAFAIISILVSIFAPPYSNSFHIQPGEDDSYGLYITYRLTSGK